MIEVLSNGGLNIVVDLGRRGVLSEGIGRSGAMDSQALSFANAMVGNAQDAAGIEASVFPFRIRFVSDARFACTGAASPAMLDDRPVASWWCRTARAGQCLVLHPPRVGARTYLTFAGGIDVPVVIGSRTTDLKAGIGGFSGRGLRKGDHLKLGRSEAALAPAFGAFPVEFPRLQSELESRRLTIRVHRGAEYPLFTQASQAAISCSSYELTASANRTGCRVKGEKLELCEAVELFSHGIVPGTIQVPPEGQPIIQLAEANTCGGYPKIASVIEADLWRLGQATPGCKLDFRFVEHDEAVAALRAQANERIRLQEILSWRMQSSPHLNPLPEVARP